MRVAEILKDPAGRLEYVRRRFAERDSRIADQYRDALLKWYGPEKGRKVKYVEAFEIWQYGRQPAPDEIKRLFPFLPQWSETFHDQG